MQTVAIGYCHLCTSVAQSKVLISALFPIKLAATGVCYRGHHSRGDTAFITSCGVPHLIRAGAEGWQLWWYFFLSHYIHNPVGTKLPQKKQTDGLRFCACVFKCELRAGSSVAVTGEWAQSEGLGVPGAEHQSITYGTQTGWVLHYNKCSATVMQFSPLPFLTV